MTEHHSPELLNAADREFLRTLALQSVMAAAAQADPPEPQLLAQDLGRELGPSLLIPCGAFVTLTKQGQLRGCIGYIEGIKPLVDTVVENAASAAVGDPRFPPVEPEEIPTLELEISVLSPLRTVSSPQDIVVGVHGVLLDKGGHRAVFLPQVAPEQGWDLDTTLTHLALKAGLGPDGWREGCRFQVFTATVF